MSRCLACGRDPLPRNLSPVRHAGQRPAGDRKRRFQACSSPFFATLMPAPVAASTRARPWPLLVCLLRPARGPGPAARRLASGRNDSVSGTIYQPSRRHIDFFVLPRCCCSCRQHGQLEMPPSHRCWHSSCLMASVPTERRRAAPRGRGRHTVSMGGCRALAPSGGSCAGGRLHSGAKLWRRSGHRHGPGGRATRHDAIMAPAIRLRCGGMATYARPYHPAQ